MRGLNQEDKCGSHHCRRKALKAMRRGEVTQGVSVERRETRPLAKPWDLAFRLKSKRN